MRPHRYMYSTTSPEHLPSTTMLDGMCMLEIGSFGYDDAMRTGIKAFLGDELDMTSTRTTTLPNKHRVSPI